MKWYLEPIENHLLNVKELFDKNRGHKHEKNYISDTLFEHTKFSRMAYDNKMIYYSAGIERPEYNGSIRIMSRHTRDRNYDFGGWKADLTRGLKTLDLSTDYALKLGYKDVWVSREESPKLLYYFQKQSRHNWTVTQEQLPIGGFQWVLRLA